EMTTANQPQVTKLPLQVRCSSQPMGLRSSLRRIQRRKKESQSTGVQNVFNHQSWRREGGCSCQAREVFNPASRIASIKMSSEISVSWPTTRNSCPEEARLSQLSPTKLARLRPAASALSTCHSPEPAGR